MDDDDLSRTSLVSSDGNSTLETLRHTAQSISKNHLLKSIASGRDWNDVMWLGLYMLIMAVAFLGNFFAFATAQWDLADRDDRKACAHLDAKWFNLYSVPLTVSLAMWIVRAPTQVRSIDRRSARHWAVPQGVGLVWWLLMRIWPKARYTNLRVPSAFASKHPSSPSAPVLSPQIILGGTAVIPSALLLTAGFFIKVDINREGTHNL